jgi:hypothetical protein
LSHRRRGETVDGSLKIPPFPNIRPTLGASVLWGDKSAREALKSRIAVSTPWGRILLGIVGHAPGDDSTRREGVTGTHMVAHLVTYTPIEEMNGLVGFTNCLHLSSG